MEDTAELERRISAAFDRMDRGLDALGRAPQAGADAGTAAGDTGQNANVDTSSAAPAILRALELAKASSDDWADRYRALQAQMGSETVAMAGEIARLTNELETARAAALAAAHASEVTAASLGPQHDDEIAALNARIAAQQDELDILRAERAAEAGELHEIISALTPLIEGASHV